MTRRAWALFSLMVVPWGCQSVRTQSAPAAHLDHVIVGVPDLEQGIAAFAAATGVVPVRGGQHPGRGTENALVSLGDGTYLEIIAPQRDASDDNEMVKALRALDRPTPAGWALRVDDAKAARELLVQHGFEASEPRAGSRRTPSGELLKWEAFGLAIGETEAVPFFIDWDPSTQHPSTTAPGGCVLERLQVEDPAGPAISRLVDLLKVSVSVQTADRTAMAIAVRCGEKDVVFTTK